MNLTAKYTKYANARLVWLSVFFFAWFAYFAVQNSLAADFTVLKSADFAHHVEKFNAMEDENFTNTISNAESWSWLQKEIPFFENA